MPHSQEYYKHKWKKKRKTKAKEKDRETHHIEENTYDNSDLPLDLVYETFEGSSFVSTGSTFSGFINRAKLFQLWQNIYFVLNVNLLKERLDFRRRPTRAPLTASRFHH